MDIRTSGLQDFGHINFDWQQILTFLEVAKFSGILNLAILTLFSANFSAC